MSAPEGCPECGSTQTRLLNVWPTKLLRRCADCGHEWYEEREPALIQAVRKGYVNAAILSTLLATGCARPVDAMNFTAAPAVVSYRLQLSPQLDARFVDATMSATSDWLANEPALDVDIALTDDACEASDCIAITSEPRAYLVTQIGVTDLLAYTGVESNKSARIVLPSDIDDFGWGSYLPVVARHELGHAFGLQHVQTEDAVMYPTTGAADHVTCADRAQFDRIHDVRSSECISNANGIPETSYSPLP